MTPGITSMTREEAVARTTALAKEIQALLMTKGEFVDIVLDALLSAYLSCADQTGRLHEVPPVLQKAAEAITQALPVAQSTKH